MFLLFISFLLLLGFLFILFPFWCGFPCIGLFAYWILGFLISMSLGFLGLWVVGFCVSCFLGFPVFLYLCFQNFARDGGSSYCVMVHFGHAAVIFKSEETMTCTIVRVKVKTTR